MLSIAFFDLSAQRGELLLIFYLAFENGVEDRDIIIGHDSVRVQVIVFFSMTQKDRFPVSLFCFFLLF